jgi:hypothetical protein
VVRVVLLEGDGGRLAKGVLIAQVQQLLLLGTPAWPGGGGPVHWMYSQSPPGGLVPGGRTDSSADSTVTALFRSQHS